MYFDSHAHVSGFTDPEPLLKRAQEKSPFHIMNICTDESTLEKGRSLAKRYPYFHNAAATVPNDLKNISPTMLSSVEEAAKKGWISAIGETGLDYYYDYASKNLQEKYLRSYLKLAFTYTLPVIFHCREAFQDLFQIADEESAHAHFPAVLHCFTGTMQEAEGVLKRGWHLSCSGIITYKKSDLLREVVKNVPLDRLLVETDSPYLAPQSKRGKTNEPLYVLEVIEKIAEIKQIDPEIVQEQTYLNALDLFSLHSSSNI